MTRFFKRLHARLVGRRRARAQGRLTARDWGATADIVLVQTCDPFAYFDLLVASSRANREFCARHEIAYAGFVGIKRGFHPWHAAFNRIALLREYVEQGFTGWVLYLDADALVVDLDWDARAYLRAKAHFAAVLAPAGEGVPDWEVNNGVAFFNLAHPSCRALIAAWNDAFARVGDAALRAAERWDMMPNDQDLLQRILRADAALRQAVFLESPRAINSREASLVRQVLRAQEPDMQSRRRAIEAEAEAALLRAGVSPAAPG